MKDSIQEVINYNSPFTNSNKLNENSFDSGLVPKFKCSNAEQVNAQNLLICPMTIIFEELCGTWNRSQSSIVLPPFIKVIT